MLQKGSIAIAASFLLTWLISNAPPARARVNALQGVRSGAVTELQEVNFTLTRLAENPKRYSLVVSDDDENTFSGLFSVDQLEILRAMMLEAEKFSLTEEAAGGGQHSTTRFMDKEEPAFLVDVQKAGNLSFIFLTLKAEIGTKTWTAGKVTRTTKREIGFFFDLLSRLESILPKLAPSK